MSIIGEMWEEKYDNLERSIPNKMCKFADWLADEGFRRISYNIWAKDGAAGKTSLYGETIPAVSVWCSTEQLIKLFLKDNK